MFQTIIVAVLMADPLSALADELDRRHNEPSPAVASPQPPAAAQDRPGVQTSRLHRVRVTGQQASWDGRQWTWQRVETGGTCVDLGGGRYATAAHVVEGVQQYVVEIEVGGEWRRGTLAAVQGHDAAVVTVGGDSTAAALTLAAPQYGQRVTVIGLKTGVAQQGTVSDTRTVSLDVDCPGITQGDSGGGVFAESGELIGIIGAKNPKEPRVVYFASADVLGETAQAKSSGGYWANQCVNGVCTQVWIPR